MNGYAIGRQNGWMSANDIRELENPDEEVLEVEEPGADGNDAGGEDSVSERNNRRRKQV